MSDEKPSPAPPDLAPPAAPPPPAAAESMVSAALLRESQATASALELRVVELESELQTRTGELDTARTSARRLSVRMATGIDDDQIADMTHARWSAAMEGAEQQVEVAAWWKATAADDELRAGMPKALQVYLPKQQGDAPPAPPVERRGAGTPPHTRRRTPAPGDDGTLTVEKFHRLSPEEQARARRAFWGAGRRTRR